MLGQIVLSPDTRGAAYAGRPIALTRREFDILACLIKKQGRFVTREEFLESCWPKGALEEMETRTIDQHVSRVRTKVGHDIIETVHGFGYIMLRGRGRINGKAAR